MKTVLPQSITTIDEAKKLLTDLYNNSESFHPEDDANEIMWQSIPDEQIPTKAEGDLLNKLMADIYNLPGNENVQTMVFDPCGFLLELDPEYKVGWETGCK